MLDILSGNSPLANILASLANLSLIVYIPLVLLEIRRANRAESHERRREREARENEIYTQLIQSYVDWQKLCLQYIDLDIADYPEENPVELSLVQAKQEQIALSILIEIFEQAFLAYLGASQEIRTYQWNGWELYMDDYCTRKNFRTIWQVSRTNMDVRFSEFMEAKIQRYLAGA